MKGLELFRSTILLYEEGAKDDFNDDDDEFTSLVAAQTFKRQKLADQLPLLDQGKQLLASAAEKLSFSNDKSQEYSNKQEESTLPKFIIN